MRLIIYITFFILLLSSVMAVNDIIPIGSGDSTDPHVMVMYVFDAVCPSTTWTCTAWSACSLNTQSRTCSDDNNCLADYTESQSCYSGVPSSGGGSSGSSTSDNYPDCPEGYFDSVCICGGSTYSYGWCLNGQYYTDYVPQVNVSVSPIVDDYKFTTFIPKYAYNVSEDFSIEINTYKNDDLYNADSVSVEIYEGDDLKQQMILSNKGLGLFTGNVINTLGEGMYKLDIKSRFGSTVVNDTIDIMVTKQSDLLNKIRKSTGELYDYVYYYLAGLAVLLFILISIIIMIRRKE